MLIHQIKILENQLLIKSALTKELSAELNVWNELYTTQQEQQGYMLNMNDDNMHPITYNPFSHAYSNYDQAIVSGEHETNANDLSNNIGMMKMIPTPTFNNQCP
ncbi:hypothetical protein P8452_59126 [Trifolium repens]|nr:hypothetical protein P8452_59126 [Trifolium repens]